MTINLFLEELKKSVPKITYLSATHMLQKNYDINSDKLSEDALKLFFSNYSSYTKYLNDYAGVIYNKYDSSVDEIYETLCKYFNENPDNKSLFEYRLTRICNQDPKKCLTLDSQIQQEVLNKVQKKIETIESSSYFINNRHKVAKELKSVKESLALVKKALQQADI